MSEEFFEELKLRIMPYFEGTNPAHDFLHTERVLNLAFHIGKLEGANLEIIKVSAILHDVARKEQDESKGKVCHAKNGAIIARKILEELNYPKEKISRVVHCVETHRFRKGNSPKTIEAKVLYDADKLDGIGAIGIGRAFSFSGHIGSFVHNLKANHEETKSYSVEDSAYREFLVKLSKVKDKMLTNTGKEMAKDRHTFMEEFFDRLNKEVEGFL